MEQVNVQVTGEVLHKQQSLPQLAEKQFTPLRWIQTVKGNSYFSTEEGSSWTPIGQNDAITWPELKGLFRRRDLQAAETYIAMLAEQGVTCMRLMLEYCQGKHRYFENPIGAFQPNMIRLWDDLFALCEKHGMRILLTPYDTFWMWLRWKDHPYHRKNGGTCSKQNQWLLCKDTRAAIKRRLSFVTQRWGGSGALFAWDLWNEIHPAHAGNSAEIFADFIQDISGFLRETEMELHGRAHPQTVSVFGPVMKGNQLIKDAIYRHPSLDFASVHFYESGTIDYPKNTVDAAISMGRLTKEALAEISDNRPFFDSEHGPIHSFKDKRITFPEPFDDEYFRHLQWAHFASGGAGGGMRWPNRHPHSLTAGMRTAQRSLAGFLSLVDWRSFQRRNWNDQLILSRKELVAFGCGDEDQAILWLFRRDSIGKDGMLRANVDGIDASLQLPMTKEGVYHIAVWDTKKGCLVHEAIVPHSGTKALSLSLPSIVTDMAMAIRRQ
ncbi:MAG: cellulase family glycosylhydrolase [Bacteroidota bacterium]|nr:cellulase family glycosylhydrolase [Bacteroidota bacterium]